ncbi:uncharacterized protein LOC106513847 [Austrofundulus limnaeus]|uniref:Uncharacterized protein LOC106513847 n=1 Tax=Austrofundulus limnaeus TaxID=52670 RepID=A0A2I4AS50_AUSLI|nr:PREDICTED: uncharacterized protein LOC106513847 [Austrofundulus limnaeus]
MDGVLEGAVVLCLCKLACSLPFLPSLAASCSPVGFCCCCLLIFTDFLFTGFLGLLCIFESWLTDLSQSGDVIALRFLLFLSHTYGTVLLLVTFLIALESLIRLLWPHLAADHGRHRRTAGSDGQGGCAKEVEETDRSVPQIVGFLCCLSVWFAAAFSVRGHWKLEEAWAALCLHTTDSLVRCLPSAFSSLPMSLCLSVLFLLVLLLTINTCLLRRCQVPARTQKTNVEKPCSCCRTSYRPVLPAPLRPTHLGTPVSEPEETENSGMGNSTYSCNGMQMLVRHHGDIVLLNCLSDNRSEQEHRRTKTGVSRTFVREEPEASHQRCGWRLWGFPSPEENVIMGLVSVLFIYTLPFNLSVNILLIRTIDSLLDWSVRSLLPSAANIRDTLTSHSVTQV